MGEERSSTGLLLQPFPISHHSSHKLLAPGERAAPPGLRVKYCFGGDPVRGLWEKDVLASLTRLYAWLLER